MYWQVLSTSSHCFCRVFWLQEGSRAVGTFRCCPSASRAPHPVSVCGSPGVSRPLWGAARHADIHAQHKPTSQFSSVAESCPTLCDCMDCSMSGFPVHHQLPELAQTSVHRVGDAIQSSHPLSSPSLPALNLSQHQTNQHSRSIRTESRAGVVAKGQPGFQAPKANLHFPEHTGASGRSWGHDTKTHPQVL